MHPAIFVPQKPSIVVKRSLGFSGSPQLALTAAPPFGHTPLEPYSAKHTKGTAERLGSRRKEGWRVALTMSFSGAESRLAERVSDERIL